MAQSSCVLLALVILNTSLVVSGYPGIFIRKNKNMKNPFYSIMAKTTKNSEGDCVQELIVDGRGLNDTFLLPCSNIGKTTVDTDKILIYEYPGGFNLFSNAPSVLIVIKDGKCTKKKYTTTKGKTMSTSKNLLEVECRKVMETMKRKKYEMMKEYGMVEEEEGGAQLGDIGAAPGSETSETQPIKHDEESEEYIKSWNL